MTMTLNCRDTKSKTVCHASLFDEIRGIVQKCCKNKWILLLLWVILQNIFTSVKKFYGVLYLALLLFILKHLHTLLCSCNLTLTTLVIFIRLKCVKLIFKTPFENFNLFFISSKWPLYSTVVKINWLLNANFIKNLSDNFVLTSVLYIFFYMCRH